MCVCVSKTETDYLKTFALANKPWEFVKIMFLSLFEQEDYYIDMNEIRLILKISLHKIIIKRNSSCVYFNI